MGLGVGLGVGSGVGVGVDVGSGAGVDVDVDVGVEVGVDVGVEVGSAVDASLAFGLAEEAGTASSPSDDLPQPPRQTTTQVMKTAPTVILRLCMSAPRHPALVQGRGKPSPHPVHSCPREASFVI